MKLLPFLILIPEYSINPVFGKELKMLESQLNKKVLLAFYKLQIFTV